MDIVVGAKVTCKQLNRFTKRPDFSRFLDLFASPQIRMLERWLVMLPMPLRLRILPYLMMAEATIMGLMVSELCLRSISGLQVPI